MTDIKSPRIAIAPSAAPARERASQSPEDRRATGSYNGGMSFSSIVPTTLASARSTKVRLIVLDIDGTLINSSFKVPEVNLRAIEAAIAQVESKSLWSPGRRFDFALPVAKELPSPLTMIVNNGALVKSKDGTTHLRHLPPVATAQQCPGIDARLSQRYSGCVRSPQGRAGNLRKYPLGRSAP